MADLQLRTLGSSDELRQYASDWDDLWERSDSDLVRGRAALVAHWIDCFDALNSFHALVVTRGDLAVAALPLVRQRVGKGIVATTLPYNDWIGCGDLLVDPAWAACSLPRLVDAVSRLDTTLLWLDQIAIDAPRWQHLRASCEAANLKCHVQELFRVDAVDVGDEFASYEQGVSKSQRSSLRRKERRLRESGELKFRWIEDASAAEVDRLMSAGLAVEDCSWKGDNGCSLLRHDAALDYIRHEAVLAAEWGQLAVAFLELDGRPIAFAYLLQAKGAHLFIKVGYDPEFRKFGPGQLLTRQILARLHEDRACQTFDFEGPSAEWTRIWSTRDYPIGRLMIAPRNWRGQSLLYAYEKWRKRPLGAFWGNG